jgi:lipopolysaccharide export system permease protein
MGSIDRYVFRTIFGAFVLVLLNLTAVIWITQILKQIDIITNQGQTILVFVRITGLLVPILMLVIAPIPVMIACLVVAGFVAFISAYLAPLLQREMNEAVAKVRTDVVANIVRPGAFTSVERGLMFHIRDRVSETQFRDIFIDDSRNREEHTTIVAEYGQIVQRPDGTFLVMRDGNVERRRPNERDPTIVVFDRYAFDLTRLAPAPQLVIGLREKYLWELLFPKADDNALKSSPGQFRAELHERLIAPLYPLAFGVIAFAVLGFPRTTRQSRNVSLVAVIVGVAGLRFGGFAAMVMAVNFPPALAGLYAAIAATLGFGTFLIWRGQPLEIDEKVALGTKALSRFLHIENLWAKSRPVPPRSRPSRPHVGRSNKSGAPSSSPSCDKPLPVRIFPSRGII